MKTVMRRSDQYWLTSFRMGFAVLLSASLLMSLAAPALEGAEQRLTVLSYPDRPAKLPLWLAQDAGLFAKYGLNVEIKTPNSGEAIADGARNNAADIYVATANWMVSAIGDGADLVFFANTGYSVLKLLVAAIDHSTGATARQARRHRRTGQLARPHHARNLAPSRSRCR